MYKRYHSEFVEELPKYLFYRIRICYAGLPPNGNLLYSYTLKIEQNFVNLSHQ